MRHLSRARRRVAGAVLIPLLLALAACSSSFSGVATGTPTATTSAVARATATPSGPPPHAFAWTQHDGTGVAQVWASLNGAAPVQITHTPAPGSGPCSGVITYGPPVFSPNLSHVVAVAATSTCGDGPVVGAVTIITVASASASSVPGTTVAARANMRAAGWIDDSTIFFIADQLYTYVLGAAAPTPVAGVTSPAEAVVRGHTLFYLQSDFASSVLTFTLHRYDLSAHALMPGGIAMGQMHMCQCSPGDFALPGWDVSHDGAHVVYQQTTPAPSPSYGIASSQIMYADADGSHASRIAQTLPATSFQRMQLSPNGQFVAFTGATTLGPVVTASTQSAGGPGDPNYHSYTPQGVGFPVWKWDNSSFWAASEPDPVVVPPFNGTLGYYQVGTASATVGVAGGYNPWYTLP
jgi:hypothetical protein